MIELGKTLLIVSFLMGCFSLEIAVAETREEKYQQENKSELEKEMEADSSKSGPTEKRKPGFYYIEKDEIDTSSWPNFIISSLTQDPEVYNLLILKIYCKDKDTLFPINPRHLNVDWEIQASSNKKRKVSGKAQTDLDGIISIGIVTQGDMASEKIEISIGDFKKKISFYKGPFEIFFRCQHAKSANSFRNFSHSRGFR